METVQQRYCSLALDMNRNVIEGSAENLREAIRKGADLRIYTEFRQNEHIDSSSDNPEMIREVSDFPATYLIDDRWVAAMMTLRQPVTLPDRFGDRASMSFFMRLEFDACGNGLILTLLRKPVAHQNISVIQHDGTGLTELQKGENLCHLGVFDHGSIGRPDQSTVHDVPFLFGEIDDITLNAGAWVSLHHVQIWHTKGRFFYTD